ncbi:hypothetical protein JCM8097_006747, partial [Rhodosporidiobolus ruineniae]
MPPKRTSSHQGKDRAASSPRPTKVKPPDGSKRPLEATSLLPFQRAILSQLVPPEDAPPSTNDAMLLIARGLGLRTIVTTFLKIYDMPEKLVLVINATEEEERGFTEEVGMRLKAVGFETGEAAREKMYKDGGLFSVTSRILIVDMLKGVVPVHLITGLVVLHAEEVKPTSQEAFVVRIYRQMNKIGFLKAFSDRPESFSFGLSPLQTTLMQLKLREVLIVPRFHEDVDTDLQKRKADVIELYQPLTHDMLDIQNAILECMEATLSEIKRSNHYLEVDDLTAENALFSSFDRIVRVQLDPVWHKVGPKTRGLVFDLTTLRKLQDYLLSYDCVRFNTYLENLLSSYSPQISGVVDKRDRPAWLGTPAADTIFTVARNRVYKQKPVLKKPDAVTAGGPRKEREMTVDGVEVPDDLDEDDWIKGVEGAENDEEEALLREMEMAEMQALGLAGSPSGADPSGSSSYASGGGGGQAGHAAPACSETCPAAQAETAEEEQVAAAWCRGHAGGAAEAVVIGGCGVSNDTILVMCNTSDTCLTLSSYLSSLNPIATDGLPSESGDKSFLEQKLSSYVYWKAHMGKLQKSLKRTPGFNKGERKSSFSSSSSSAAAASASGNGASSSSSTATAGSFASNKRPSSSISGEGELSAALKRKDFARGKAPSTKGRRVRGGGAAGAATGAMAAAGGAGGGAAGGAAGGGQAMFAAATGANPEALEEDAQKLADSITALGTDGAPASPDPSAALEDEAFDATAFQEFFGLISNEDLVIVRPYLGDEDDRVLEELRPKYVVMYDPNPAFVRRIEAYRAAHQGLAIRVYFLVYKDSVEEQKYLSEIRREKDAFVRLIEEKGSMAIPHEAEYRPGEEEAEVLRTVSSRVGGKQVTTGPPQVIVDLREFRSSLPGLLHAGKFDVVPVTLRIGDYILTPEMAVARKSIPDLISSFNSGRLFQQCELMTAHYKQPILLIEFDEKKSFNLETYVENRPSSASSDVDLRSKLVLLTISFPKLRIMWSSSPYQTVEIFRDLKQNRDEPDSDKAVLVGVEEGEGGGGGGGGAAPPPPGGGGRGGGGRPRRRRRR